MSHRALEQSLRQAGGRSKRVTADGLDLSSPAGKGKKGKRVFRAPFAGSQKRIRAKLGITHKVEKEAWVSMGRSLDEASNAFTQRCVLFGSTGNEDEASPKRLTTNIAWHALMSMIPDDEARQELRDEVNRVLRGYHAPRE